MTLAAAAMLASMPVLVAAAPVPDTRTAIEAVLAASAAGWNAGDLDRFVAIYAPDATFVTRAGLVQGREAIAAHYRPSSADGRNRRGVLSFTILATRVIGPAQILVFARYHLEAVPGEDGPTTLLFERRREGWRIVADHSG